MPDLVRGARTQQGNDNENGALKYSMAAGGQRWMQTPPSLMFSETMGLFKMALVLPGETDRASQGRGHWMPGLEELIGVGWGRRHRSQGVEELNMGACV